MYLSISFAILKCNKSKEGIKTYLQNIIVNYIFLGTETAGYLCFKVASEGTVLVIRWGSGDHQYFSAPHQATFLPVVGSNSQQSTNWHVRPKCLGILSLLCSSKGDQLDNKSPCGKSPSCRSGRAIDRWSTPG